MNPLGGLGERSVPQADEARLRQALADIGSLDEASMAAARAHQAQLTKPPGSLGRLEDLAVRLAGIAHSPHPTISEKALIICAADHGVVAEGVSAYPSAVTAQMILNFVRGGAAINVLARRAGARVLIADLGVAHDFPTDLPIAHAKIGRGTASIATGPAMTHEAALRSIVTGIELVEQIEGERTTHDGLLVVGTGDMGIGNTTASSAIVAALTGAPVAQVTGRGTGIDETAWRHKVATIERALALNTPDPHDALDVLAKVGGYEIGAIAGVTLGAAARRLPVVIDGFISGAAALLAATLCPPVTRYIFAAHRSVEAGHRVVLERLDLEPLLDLGMRLGEGTGAALAMRLLEDALAIHTEMATFESAGISGPI